VYFDGIKMTDQTVSVTFLRHTIMDEINSAFGLPKTGFIRHIMDAFYWLPADRFAQIGVHFDQIVASLGFCEAAQWLLPRFVQDTFTMGVEQVPVDGPLLITSNHPGIVDSIAISANLPRDDIKIIASGIPFIDHLPFTRRHIIFATQNIQERMLAIRSSIRHLQEGGALLIFPSGNLDPDPAVLPGAKEALSRWSPSLEIILRIVPQTQVLLTIVSGVISQSILRHPLINFQKGFRERQKLAEFLQVIQQLVSYKNFELIPRITFEALNMPLDHNFEETPRGLLQHLIAKAQQLLQKHITAMEK
jgi:hypothetical protein